MAEKEQTRIPTKWICDDLVCLVDGLAFGLDEETGVTICIGKAADLLAALNGEGEIDERMELLAHRSGINEFLFARTSTSSETTGEGTSLRPSEHKGKVVRRKGNDRLPARVAKNIHAKAKKEKQ